MKEVKQSEMSERPEDRVFRISEMAEIKVLLEMEKLVCLETYEHSISVAFIVAKMLDISSHVFKDGDEIIKGALLHDIGKIFLPFNLTQIPRTLTSEEYDIIKTHTALSYEITKPVFSQTVQNICLYHHERPNGTGYMKKAKLANIPEEALFVQVADIYDALTRERPYKRKYDSNGAVVEMDTEAQGLYLDDGFLDILKRSIKGEDVKNELQRKIRRGNEKLPADAR